MSDTNYVPMPMYMKTDADGKGERSLSPKGARPPATAPVFAARVTKPQEAVEIIDKAHPEASKACKALLYTYLNNLVSDPDNPKFRKVGVRNPFFVSQIKNVPGGMELLMSSGFVLSNDQDWLVYSLPDIGGAKAGRDALIKSTHRPASERKEEKEKDKREREREKEREREAERHREREREAEKQREKERREKERESQRRGGAMHIDAGAAARGPPTAAVGKDPLSPRRAGAIAQSTPMLLASASNPKLQGAFFGASLKQVMERQKEKFPSLRVPRFFLQATRFLLQHGLTFEGVFRISARTEAVMAMKERIDATHPDYEFMSTEEVPTVTAVLTAFLRELTSPLLPADFYHELLSLVTEKQAQFPDVQLALLTKIIANIPTYNQALLSELFWFLSTVAQNSDYNKMTRDNLSRLMGPNIIWIKHTPQTDITKMYLDSERVTGLVSLILTNYRAIFQDVCPPLAWKEEIGLHGRVFAGNKKPVVSITQVTPRLVWLLDSSNAVRVWDVVQFTFLKEFIIDKGAVLHVAGIEGRVWVCSSRALTIYNPETGTVLKEHATAAFSAERGLDPRTVLVALWDGIRSFDVETLEPSGPFFTTPPDAKILRLAGGRLWTGASKSVCVFDNETRAILREHRPHTRPVVSLIELCDQRILSAASDGSLAVFSIETLEPMQRIDGINPAIRLIGAVSPHGTDYLFTASQDGTLRQYSSRSLLHVRDICAPPGEPLSSIALITRSPADTAPYLCVGFNDIHLSLFRVPNPDARSATATTSPQGSPASSLIRQQSLQPTPVQRSPAPPMAAQRSGSDITGPLASKSARVASPQTPPIPAERSKTLEAPPAVERSLPPLPTLPVPINATVQPQLSPSSAASGGSNSMISRSPRSLAMQADPNALILPAEGFRVENGKKSPLPGLELNMYDYSDHYKTHFAGRKQFHFVGYKSADDSAPTIVSVLVQPETGKFPEPVFKGLVRTKTSGQDMFYIPSSDLAKLPIPRGREKEDPLTVRMQTHLESVFFHGSRLNLVGAGDVAALEADLLEFERNDPERSNCFAFGVVYVKEGQTTPQEFWENEHGSAGFERFLALLGERVRLKGWSKFRGGLDVVNDTKGQWSVYTKFQEKFEVMFHVSTLLPFQAFDPLKLTRARQVQNDVVVLLYIEGSQPYAPETMPTNVSHVFTVVRPVQEDGETKYRIAVASKDNVNPFRPDLPTTTFKHDDYFRQFLLTKMLNGQIAARKSGLQMMFTRPRAALLEDLVSTYKQKQQPRSVAMELLRSLSPTRVRLGEERDNSKESANSNQRGRERERPESPPPQTSPHSQPATPQTQPVHRGLGALFHRAPTTAAAAAAASAAHTPHNASPPSLSPSNSHTNVAASAATVPVSPSASSSHSSPAASRSPSTSPDEPTRLGRGAGRREISPQVEQSLSRVEELLQRVNNNK